MLVSHSQNHSSLHFSGDTGREVARNTKLIEGIWAMSYQVYISTRGCAQQTSRSVVCCRSIVTTSCSFSTLTAWPSTHFPCATSTHAACVCGTIVSSTWFTRLVDHYRAQTHENTPCRTHASLPLSLARLRERNDIIFNTVFWLKELQIL